ncbi:MAG: hypothetical protein S4CHLAM2_07090 [Chlamydiales bacterium]|nr:hypothetical protein [Chlamydiales bacterium]
MALSVLNQHHYSTTIDLPEVQKALQQVAERLDSHTSEEFHQLSVLFRLAILQRTDCAVPENFLDPCFLHPLFARERLRPTLRAYMWKCQNGSLCIRGGNLKVSEIQELLLGVPPQQGAAVEAVDLSACSEVDTLGPLLALFPRVTKIVLDELRKLTSFAGVSDQVTYLSAKHCEKVEDLRTLPAAVETLYLDYCHQIKHFPALLELKTLSLRGITKLGSVNTLAACTKLEEVDLRGTQVKDVSPIPDGATVLQSQQ